MEDNRIHQIEVLERKVQVHGDRVEKLDVIVQENAGLNEALQVNQNYIETAKAYLADFPQDAFVLKLERRVESLRDQIKQAERIASQHRAGIDAYARRLEHCRLGRAETAQGMSDVLDEVEDSLVSLCNEEIALTPNAEVDIATDVLTSIASERESALQAQEGFLLDKIKEETEIAAGVSLLQLRSQEELPAIEQVKQMDEDEISAEWAKENQYLQSLHEKLLAVHREQTFHLQRGTHIKSTANVSAESEKVLSARQSLLANEINTRVNALEELREDVTHAKKLADSLRVKARAAQKEYEVILREKESRLQKFRIELADTTDELDQLRNTKAQLYQALQDIRDNNPARSLRIMQ